MDNQKIKDEMQSLLKTLDIPIEDLNQFTDEFINLSNNESFTIDEKSTKFLLNTLEELL